MVKPFNNSHKHTKRVQGAYWWWRIVSLRLLILLLSTCTTTKYNEIKQNKFTGSFKRVNNDVIFSEGRGLENYRFVPRTK